MKCDLSLLRALSLRIQLHIMDIMRRSLACRGAQASIVLQLKFKKTKREIDS